MRHIDIKIGKQLTYNKIHQYKPDGEHLPLQESRGWFLSIWKWQLPWLQLLVFSSSFFLGVHVSICNVNIKIGRGFIMLVEQHKDNLEDFFIFLFSDETGLDVI